MLRVLSGQVDAKYRSSSAGQSREAKDASGHDHDAKGRFGKGGGGGDKKTTDKQASGGGDLAKEPWEMTKSEAMALAPSTVEPDEDNLEDIASALRDAMEEAVGDPKDQCIACAWALKSLYPDAEIWEGLYYGEPHTLAKLGGKFIDVTADQFGRTDDAVQVLDPDDLPHGYKRFDLVGDSRDPSSSRWPTQVGIAAAFKRNIGDDASGRVSNRHLFAVRDALAAGKLVPKEVLADYPHLAPKPAQEAKDASGHDHAAAGGK
jgi:hypothetical protein